MNTQKALLTDRLIPIEKDGKTIWLTQDQYDDIFNKVESECLTTPCKIREKKFHVPDFIRGKTLINEQLA